MVQSTGRQVLIRLSIPALPALLLIALAVPGAFAQDADEGAHAILSPLNDSGIEGTAALTAEGDQTFVQIRADGALGVHPTHIHEGTCDDLNPNPEFPLTNVVLQETTLTGASETTIDVPLDDVLDEPHLILIHRSESDIGTYYACGDIVPGTLSVEQAGGQAGRSPIPDTGAGIAGSAATTWLGSAAIAAALTLALGLLMAPRRQRAPFRLRRES